VRRPIIALIAAAAGELSLASGSAAGDYWRLPNGNDNLMPRYYDYRAPRAFYIDEAPVAYRLHGLPNQPYGYPNQPYAANGTPPYPPAVIIYPAPVPAPPIPMYAPSAYVPPVNVYAPPPVQGYPIAPVVPNVMVRPQPICGVYRFWRDDRCVDARGY
jgi:hypothetical protein